MLTADPGVSRSCKPPFRREYTDSLYHSIFNASLVTRGPPVLLFVVFWTSNMKASLFPFVLVTGISFIYCKKNEVEEIEAK